MTRQNRQRKCNVVGGVAAPGAAYRYRLLIFIRIFTDS